MNLVNEKVQHVSFGIGIITEFEDGRLSVKFEEGMEAKIFLFPDAFGKFLKAESAEIQDYAVAELQKKLELIEKKRQEKEEEALAAKLERQQELNKKTRKSKK